MNNIEKEFILYPFALRMKQLGFDEPCMAIYFGNGLNELFTFNPEISNEMTKKMVELGHIPCPTFSQAFRWFRKKYSLDSFCRQTNLDGRSYYKISRIETDEIIKGYSNFTKTYEEAELAALIRLIEIVESKTK